MYDAFVLFTDVLEQLLIAAMIFTVIPVKGSQTKVNYSFLILSLLLLVLVRVSNALILYEGWAIYIVVAIVSVYMRFLTDKKMPFIVLIVGFVFCIVFMNASVAIPAITLIFNIEFIDYAQSPELYVLGVIITKIMLLAEFLVCRKFFKNTDIVFDSKKWSSIMVIEYLVFSLLVAFFTQVFNGYSYEVNVIGIMLSLGLFIAELIAFAVLNREQKEKNQLYILLDKMEFEQKYYAEALAQYNEMKRLKHDLKHMNDMIYDLASKNKNDEILRVLNAPQYDLLKNQGLIVTGNGNLDYILNLKGSLCEKKGIQIQYVVEQVDLSFIEDMDLFVLIGNILDNAIEHCADNKTVSFTIKKKKNSILLTCINSTNLADTETKGGILPTTKENKQNHGYGLLSIKTIADKYHADFNYSIQNQEFKLVLRFDEQ